MKLYHGTASTFLASIREKGLVPDAEPLQVQWPLSLGSGYRKETEQREIGKTQGRVFATQELVDAKMFARFRALYEHAKVGSYIPFGSTFGVSIPEELKFLIEFKKLHGTANPEARPALITLSVPEHLIVGPDPGFKGRKAWLLQPVPASLIRHVEVLPFEESETDKDQQAHDYGIAA